MGNSKYPNKLDTSIEIPAVRDNIVEVGSDVLNSLRSAVFNIERALGVNPQGASGNTVATRLNKALDGNGNILKEALDTAGLVSGPIIDSDVSNNAGIDESKLKLKYPTQLLQDEISQLIKQIDIMAKTLEELSYLFAAHTHPEAKNRHKAIAINVDAIGSSSSSSGIISTEQKELQTLLENLFASHINYDGSNISSTNRSHKANQVFFDNTDTSAFIESDDVQGAIEDVLNQTSGQLDVHQNLHHSNGMIRATSDFDFTENDVGPELLEEQQQVIFSEYSTEETTRISSISFLDPPDLPAYGIERSDVLRLYSNSDGQIFDYQIHSIILSGDSTKITSINVFGRLHRASLESDSIKVFSNKNKKSNPAGFLTSARPYPGAVNLDLIQIANPSGATILSKSIRPSEISFSNRYFNLIIDETKTIEVDAYMVGVDGHQTIDSIINAINISLAAQAASALAYRVDYDNNFPPEIAITHSLGSTTGDTYSLKVQSINPADTVLESLGLSYIEDSVQTRGTAGEVYIQGEATSGLSKKMEQAGLTLLAATSSVTSDSAGINFSDYGIIDGDLLIITNTPNDDGTYVIKEVSENSIRVDNLQLLGGIWQGSSLEDSKFYVLNNTVFLKDLEFLSSLGSGNLAVVDIFIDKHRNPYYNTRLEHGIETYLGSESLATVFDFNGPIDTYTEESPGIMSLSLNDKGMPQISLDSGEEYLLEGVSNSYIYAKSGLYNIYIKVFISNYEDIVSKITNEGSFDIYLYGHAEVNKEENFMLSRAAFNSRTSRVVGNGFLGPKLFKLREDGITSDKDLSSSALKTVYQGPISETRSNGVTEGLFLTPADTPIDEDDNYVVNLSGGTCYVRGKRYRFDGFSSLVTGVKTADADKVFIAISETGEIVFGGANSGGGTVECASPFSADSNCILSCLEYDSVTVRAIDLRLFLDNLDLKLLNSVTVSPQPGMGHFESFNHAIKYAKRFSDMFPEAGVPTIHLKSGVHNILLDMDVTQAAYNIQDAMDESYSSGAWINFPVNIEGEGHSTVIDIAKAYSDRDISEDDRETAGSGVFAKHATHLFIAGPGLDSDTTPDGDNDVIDSGFVTIKNLRMRLCSILISDPRTENNDGEKFNWGVNIENVIFDYSDRESFGKGNIGVWIRKHSPSGNSSSTDYVGNISIKNCQFLNSIIRTYGFNLDRHRNISIIDNVFRGNGASSSGEGNYAFYTGDDTQGLIEFGGLIEDGDPAIGGNSPPENNITIRGNISADSNDSATLPEWSDGSIWADRISTNLVVGGKVGIKTGKPGYTLDVNGDMGVDGDGYIAGDVDVEGDLAVVGDITITGEINYEHPNPSLPLQINGDVLFQDSDITITDSLAYLSVTSTNGYNALGSELRLQRSNNSLSSSMHLGEIRFQGQQNTDDEAGTAYAGAAIVSRVATSSWGDDDQTSDISFWTKDMDDWDNRMTIEPNGRVVINGGKDLTEDADSGSVKITYPNSTRVMHIDSNEIQIKDPDGADRLPLLLNPLGSYVQFGGLHNGQYGDETPKLRIEGNVISAVAGDSGYGNVISLNDAVTVAGNLVVEGTYTTVDNITAQDTIVAKRIAVVAGTARGEGSQLAAQFVGNSGVTVDTSDDEGGNTLQQPVVLIKDYQSDARDGYALGIQLADVTKAEMDDGQPSTDTAEFFVLFLDSEGSAAGYIAGNGGSVEYGGFTGSHITPVSKSERDDFYQLGLIVSSNGVALTDKFLSEPYVGTTVSKKQKDKAVLGVISGGPRLYDKGITLSEWKKDVYGITVNSLGNGRVWVTNITGDIENGDFICSSNIPGYGQMQDDDLMHNYTVAKATECVDWDKVTDTITHNGVEYKKFLIACSYHCG